LLVDYMDDGMRVEIVDYERWGVNGEWMLNWFRQHARESERASEAQRVNGFVVCRVVNVVLFPCLRVADRGTAREGKEDLDQRIFRSSVP